MPTMRAPDGRTYEVAESDVAAMQRDQGWTLGTEAPSEPARTVRLKSRDGRLYEASPEEAATLQRDQDMALASPEEVATREHERELYGRYGGAGQQALGLAEAFYRNASLGVIQGLIGDEREQRDRAGVTRQESPFLYGAAGAAPAIAAGIATGGAGLGVAGTMAAEGALGGLAAFGSESDAAFIEDRELSAEQAWGAFGKGALLGAGAAGAVMGAARALNPVDRALRNRFAEAAGRAERRAERSAFRSVGIDDPVPGLAEAVVKPAKAAEMRERGRAAAVQVREEFGGTLERLEQLELAAQRWAPDARMASGDAALQRAAIRKDLDALRKDLEPIARPQEKGLVSRAFELIDRSESPADLYAAVQISKRAFADGLAGAGDAATARALERGVKRLDELEGNEAIFGAPARESAERAQALSDLADARQMLTDYLGSHNYLEVTGMRAGKDIDDALDTYVDRLGQVISLSKGMPEAKEAKKAFAQLQSLREGPLREVAALNQADAISALDVDDVRPRSPSGTEAIVDIAENAAKVGAAPQYQAWKVAKMAWKARKLATAAPEQRAKIAGDLALDAASLADPIVGPAKLAYKYRHHVAVLVEAARDEVESAAKQLAGTAKREGAVPLARRYATEAFGEDNVRNAEQIVSRARSLAGQRGFVDIKKRNLRSRLTPDDRRSIDKILPEKMSDEQFDRVMAMDRFPGKLDVYTESDENTGKLLGVRAVNNFTVNGEGGVISRAFFNRGKQRDVVHDVFEMPASTQGRGIGKQIINDAFDVYSDVGISKATVENAVDVGRYLWPKMGFRPAPEAEKLAIKTFGEWMRKGGADFRASEFKTLKDIALTDEGKEWLLSTTGPWNKNLVIKIAPSKQAGHVALDDTHGDYFRPLTGDWSELRGKLAAPGDGSKPTRGRDFSLGDIAKSPMGVVTGAGAVAFGASAAVREYQQHRQAIEKLEKEPGLLAEKLAAELGNMPTEAPELVMDLNAIGISAVRFLASKLAPSYGFSLMYPEGPPPSSEDIVSTRLYIRGVTQPSEVVQAIADGTAMPEEIEAFRAVYPRRFAMLQRATHTEVQLANQEGRVIPASRIMTLETVLDMPGQLDPTFGDDVAAVAQANNAQQQEQRAASYVPPPRAGQRIAPTGGQ